MSVMHNYLLTLTTSVGINILDYAFHIEREDGTLSIGFKSGHMLDDIKMTAHEFVMRHDEHMNTLRRVDRAQRKLKKEDAE